MEFPLFENATLLFTIMNDVLFGEGITLLGINFCTSDTVVVVEKGVCIDQHIGSCGVLTGLKFLMYIYTE
jgi:hypothetical protein